MKTSNFKLQTSVFHSQSTIGYRPSAIIAALLLAIPPASAQQSTPHPIDLPSALKLAGAQNLDIKIARERLAEARANHSSALAQFFPWISPGITYRQHDDKIQDVQGNIIDVNKYSYAPGAALAAQVDIGDALYKSLAAKQLVKAAGHALEAQRQDSVLAAAEGYFNLALAYASIGVSRESLRIATDYEQQIQRGVGAGVAFKGDELRVTVQQQRSQLDLRQAIEQERIASARLSQTLHLDPTVELIPQDSEFVPLDLVETNTALDSLVQRTLASRPELKQSQSLLAASRDAKSGTIYGPLIPSLGAQLFFGGLGGGRSGIADTFGAQEDYCVGLSWRIGPGGLFDFTRTRATQSRMNEAGFVLEKLRDDVTRQVVEAFTRWQSLGDQLATAKSMLGAAEQALQLAEQRKEFAVGVVLETIQAEQDLARARLDYLRTVADFNRAQYVLKKATGEL